jgi:shikimate kinase
MLRLRQLLEQREAIYHEAQHRVSTDMLSPEQVAEVIAELARGKGGW